MKKIALYIIVSILMVPALGQKLHEETFKWNKQVIEIDLPILDSIKVMTTNDDVVKVSMRVDINNNRDNDKYAVDFDSNAERIKVSGKLDSKKLKCSQSDIYCELYVPKSADLKINTISGDIIAQSGLADIDFKTISGFIDLAFEPSKKANIKGKTISGMIYSDLNFEHKEGIKNKIVGAELDAKLNGGGSQVNLETISGNLYLRNNKN